MILANNISDRIFIKRWKKHTKKLLKKSYPEISKKEIDKFLNKEVMKYVKDHECYIDNDYLGKRIKSTLLEIYDWIVQTKPICGGFGVFYRNQHQVDNPLLKMILKFLKSRKAYKSRLKDFDPDSYEYATFDRKQLTEKVNTNSIYGALGLVSSFLFNKYTAPSVTATGQSLISTTCEAFEAFMANNVAFNNIDECMTFLYNISTEDYDTDILPDISLEQVEERIINMFYRYKTSYYESIHNYLEMLSGDELKRIYYKNNLYEFSDLDFMHDLLDKIITKCDEFKNPNKVPKCIEEDMKTLWTYYKTYVFYNHSPIDRIQRLKNDKRKCVVTIDTDSNMLNLNPWVEYAFNNFYINHPINSKKDKTQVQFIVINIMAFVITNMITDVLWRATGITNIPEDYREYVNMKNEFLFSRMILASKKKRYMSSVKLREGEEFIPEKMDSKGLDFKKSTTSKEVEKTYTNMVKKHILQSEYIDLHGMNSDVLKFEDDIKESLSNGGKEYLSPMSVKELAAYADPYKGQGIRAVHASSFE